MAHTRPREMAMSKPAKPSEQRSAATVAQTFVAGFDHPRPFGSRFTRFHPYERRVPHAFHALQCQTSNDRAPPQFQRPSFDRSKHPTNRFGNSLSRFPAVLETDRPVHHRQPSKPIRRHQHRSWGLARRMAAAPSVLLQATLLLWLPHYATLARPQRRNPLRDRSLGVARRKWWVRNRGGGRSMM